MFRQIADIFKRRAKVLEGKINLQATLNLLSRLDANTTGSIFYQEKYRGFYSEKTLLRNIVNFVEDHFNNKNNFYNNVKYHIYQKDREERHRLLITSGKNSKKYRNNIETETPIREALIDFVVKK